ncbi:hypothetical protein [Caballeronia glebae]|nr:hypothetical protein [Caballeronia glebae]
MPERRSAPESKKGGRSSLFTEIGARSARFSRTCSMGPTKTSGYRVYLFAMAKNSQFSLGSIGRGSNAVATELAISTRIAALEATIKTRITKISIKAITIR